MGKVDKDKIEQSVKLFLEGIGEDITREGLVDTPNRVYRMWQELFDKHELDYTVFEEQCDQMILVKNIPFYSYCEHHLVPFFGVAHIAYLPDGKLLGISKLARILDKFASRPQIQERLTNSIADHISNELKPMGVGVILEAQHLCMDMRGVKKSGSKTVTSALKGCFKDNDKTRNEFIKLVK